MIENNAEIVTRFIQAMSSGDAETAAGCLAPDAVAVTKGFSKFTGTCNRGTILKMIASLKGLVPTGLDVTILEVIADGDRVAVEFEGNAMTADGVPYCNQYCMVFYLEQGKIKRSHEYFCTMLAEEVLWPLLVRSGFEPRQGRLT